MGKGLDNILNNWENYRQKCLDTAKELDWYNRAEKLVKIYQEVI
jgi:hypothetical protein